MHSCTRNSVHGANYIYGATIFPQQINAAASFNRDLLREMGRCVSYPSLCVQCVQPRPMDCKTQRHMTTQSASRPRTPRPVVSRGCSRPFWASTRSRFGAAHLRPLERTRMWRRRWARPSSRVRKAGSPLHEESKGGSVMESHALFTHGCLTSTFIPSYLSHTGIQHQDPNSTFPPAAACMKHFVRPSVDTRG